jgi:hypothetical protein
MYQADLAGGWVLKFPTPGNYEIRGNLQGTIVPVAGVYVERRTSAAYITTSIGATGVTPDDVWSHPGRTLTGVTDANVRQVNSVPITGAGVPGNSMRPA